MSDFVSKITQKQLIANPLGEVTRLFGDPSEEQPHRWEYMHFERAEGAILAHPDLLEDFFSGRELRIHPQKWEDPLQIGNKALNILPYTQRHRPASLALDALHQYKPDLFYERWLPWTEAALKSIYLEDKEEALSAGQSAPSDLYRALRSTSLRVVARTVCSSFKGALLSTLEESLEGIDTAYARLAFGGNRARFAWLPGSDIKVAGQSLKALEASVRPLIRERIGGTSQGDDLITRWVNTRGKDGRSLKEDQIIEEVVTFLVMGYTSLPKLLFGAVISINQDREAGFLAELKRELNGVVKLMTAPPIADERTPPPITPQNESAWRTIPLHNSVIMETLRLYAPHWLSQYQIDHGVFILGHQQIAGESGPTLDTNTHVWLSPYQLHRDPNRFRDPTRFWPQRWSGNLEAQLPKYGFAPFGFGGKSPLSEVYCREMAPRILLMWFARYTTLNVPEEVEWEMSLCLRPTTPISWLHMRDIE